MAELTICPVTDENRAAVLALDVAPGQRRHIETTRECLEEAATSPRWHPVAIVAGDILVGFAMYGRFPAWQGEGEWVWLDRLLIDQRYQGQGHGEAALLLLLKTLEADYGCRQIYLSVYEDNARAIALYEKHGFRFNGMLDTKGEKVMCRCRRLGM